MEKAENLFLGLSYNRLVMVVACLSLVIHALLLFRGPNFILKNSPGLFIAAAQVAIFAYGTFVAWKKWDDATSINHFVCYSILFILLATCLKLFLLWTSSIWGNWEYLGYDVLIPKSYYTLYNIMKIIGLSMCYAIPVIALFPRLSEFNTLEFTRTNIYELQNNIKNAYSTMQKKGFTMNSKLENTNTYSTKQDTITENTQSIGSSAVSDELYLSFVRQNASYYLPHFAKFYLLGGNFAVSWNWAGFFLPQVWFFYRKMYLFGVIALLVTSFFHIIGIIGWLLAGIIVGVCGNYLYYWHATTKLTALQTSPVKKENLIWESAMLGGTNMVLALLILFVNILILLAFIFASTLTLLFLSKPFLF